MKNLSKESIYKSNQKKAKVIGFLTPFVFWGLLALSILCFILAVKDSLGNIAEITSMLETTTHTGEELSNNYQILVEKYGEWVIGNGNKGFQMVFINIKNAVFSGFMILTGIMFILFLLSSFILGKWLLPMVKEKILQDNQDMVNLTILHNDNK